MIEAALRAQSATPTPEPQSHLRLKAGYAAVGGLVAVVGVYALGLF